MADLKSQIRKRLNAISAESERLERKLASLSERADELRSLLGEPVARGRRKAAPKSKASAVAKAIESCLQTGAKSKKEVVKLLTEKQFDFGTKAAGRVVHFTLANMKREGSVSEGNDGQFFLPSRGGTHSRNGKTNAEADA